MADFADWAGRSARLTNRSLAGSRIYLAGPAEAASAGERASLQRAVVEAQLAAWGLVPVAEPERADFVFDLAASASGATDSTDSDSSDQAQALTQADTFDLPQADGLAAIAHAQAHMPVTTALVEDLRRRGALQGLSLAVCLILEPKTAVFLRLLAAAGAKVGIYSDSESTDPRVAEQLRQSGIDVFVGDQASGQERQAAALAALDAIQPDLIIDDGASFARLALMERPALAGRLIGVAEETTSGVRAFDRMEAEGALAFPVVAVNDSQLKTAFDNAHGTGETCVTTMLDLLGPNGFSGRRVSLVGYGPVGQGFARRIRALGAQVTVCDISAVAALKAAFDGFPVATLAGSLAQADLVVSATGVRHTIELEHLQAMRPGTQLAVIGGVANEIALDQLPGFGYDQAPLRPIQVPNGPELTLLSNGDGVNYTAGPGNPIEIMDLSFAVQTCALDFLLRGRGRDGQTGLGHRVYRLGAESDERIARLALAARGVELGDPAMAAAALQNPVQDWRLTRFADEAAHRTAGTEQATPAQASQTSHTSQANSTHSDRSEASR